MSITTWAATSGDWDDSKFSQAWNGPAMSPETASLSLVPNWDNISGDWASSTQDWNVGFNPTLTFGLHHSPANANLEFIQSYEWDELTTAWVDTPGTWTSGPVPQVAIGTGISPAKSDLTFTAYSPVSGIKYDFKVTASTLTLTGQLPKDGTGFVISPDNVTLTILQTYSWANFGGTWANASGAWSDIPFVPTAVETGQNQPDAGSLTLTGTAPDRTIQRLWYVPSGSLSLSGFVPKDLRGHKFIPDAGSITGLATTQWNNVSGDWASSSDTWGTGTLTPIAGVTYTFTIDSAGNLVFTPYDPEWPLVKDPYYISQVVIS